MDLAQNLPIKIKESVHGPGPWKWSIDPVQRGGPWTPGPCFVLTRPCYLLQNETPRPGSYAKLFMNQIKLNLNQGRPKLFRATDLIKTPILIPAKLSKEEMLISVKVFAKCLINIYAWIRYNNRCQTFIDAVPESLQS